MTNYKAFLKAAETMGEKIMPSTPEELAMFADMVASAERAACAEICDEIAERNKRTNAHVGWVLGNEECATAIRERGQA